MDPLLRPIDSLLDKSLNILIDTLDINILDFYATRQDEVTDEALPNFGPVKNIPLFLLIRIIEELIKREELTCQHLRFLLPTEVKTLPCNEDSACSHFLLDTIELISRRCPNFEKLHFHVELEECHARLRESILRLKGSLKEISLYDSYIESETIRIIATNCSELKELNLLGTSLSDEGLNYLYDEESVIKNSLTKLIIDETRVSAESVGQCLLNLQNLTHFQYDRTIEACLFLFEDARKRSSIIPFKTTIFKSKLDIVNDEQLMNRELQNWIIEKFPEVDHLILISIKKRLISFVDHLIRSWRHISHLELSSRYSALQRDEEEDEENFNLLKPAFEASSRNLTTLKLEIFYRVDISYLGEIFINLEKLALLNNMFLSTNALSFRNLKQVEIFYHYFENYYEIRKFTEGSGDRAPWDLSENDWMSLFSSQNLEKVFIYNQYGFSNKLFIRLLQMGYLRNLKEFKVFYCNLRRDGILRVLDERIPVEKLVVGLCPDISRMDGDEISRIIRDNNYITNFYMVMENPNFLRWLLIQKL